MKEDGTSADKAWYERWFGREYLEIYAHRNDAEAKSDIDAIEKLIPLQDHQPILDLACGNGRHSFELYRRGYQVTGIDLSEELLEQARQRASELHADISFERYDMRGHPYADQFGTVINMFTSFGYFENDAENGRIMAAIQRALKPGGRFLIDYINMHSVLASLVPEDEKQINGKRVRQQRRYNRETKRLEKIITISDEAGDRQFNESVRLYSRDEMITLAEESGLHVDATPGSLAGEEFNEKSPRLIILGHNVQVQ